MDRLRKYLLLILHLISAITYVKCDGQIAILEKPSSMKLQSGSQITTGEFLESLEHLLGYQYEGAKQMEMMNVFDYAGLKIILMRVDDTTSDIDSISAVKKYQMTEDLSLDDILNELLKRTANKNSLGMNVHVNQLAAKELAAANDGSPQVMWADLRSMPEDELLKTMANLMKSTEGSRNVLKIMVSSDGKISAPYDRQKRQESPAPPEETGDKKKEVVNAKTLNLADDYDENFPVIFNIMLWFSMALIFALIAICMVIANMDPGRDSIIYRMTSTRMKKDN